MVGIDAEGRPHVLPSESVEYHPQEREIKYFLIQFVHDHYSRMRATAKEDYARSLYFLEAQLADALIESSKNSKAIESFLAGQGEENDVKITNVSIEDLRTSPYHATVDFEKVYLRRGPPGIPTRKIHCQLPIHRQRPRSQQFYSRESSRA